MSNSVWWEIVVVGIGVVVAAPLGIGQLQISRAQNALLEKQAEFEVAKSEDDRRQSADALEVQVMTMVAPQLALMRDSGQKGKDAQDIVTAAVEYLLKHD